MGTEYGWLGKLNKTINTAGSHDNSHIARQIIALALDNVYKLGAKRYKHRSLRNIIEVNGRLYYILSSDSSAAWTVDSAIKNMTEEGYLVFAKRKDDGSVSAQVFELAAVADKLGNGIDNGGKSQNRNIYFVNDTNLQNVVTYKHRKHGETEIFSSIGELDLANFKKLFL